MKSQSCCGFAGLGKYRDAKTYKRVNNVCVKNSIWGKIFAKFYAVLSRKWVMSWLCAFWCCFLANLAFFALYGSFGPLTLFFREINFLYFTPLGRVCYKWGLPCLVTKRYGSLCSFSYNFVCPLCQEILIYMVTLCNL